MNSVFIAESDSYVSKLVGVVQSNHIKTGDMILTSGDGGVYPPRVIVGKVSELGTDTSDASSYALIEPAADYGSLTEAAVVISFTEKGVTKAE